MWPKLLDLSPDECRGMLRRLGIDENSCELCVFVSRYEQPMNVKFVETHAISNLCSFVLVFSLFIAELQSYSQVVSTFRAQGILNEMKMKVLRDLREAFHITDDRHKAEVRRVVNDEAFSTIAKV